jgi:hypothetical protein
LLLCGRAPPSARAHSVKMYPPKITKLITTFFNQLFRYNQSTDQEAPCRRLSNMTPK